MSPPMPESGQKFNPVVLEVLWQRLLAILEESAWTIVRSSFSSAVREAWDFSCLLYDRSGRMIAQNAGVSGKIGVWHTSIPEILARFPEHELAAQDVIVSNDPWLTEGHLYDTTVVMPILRQGRLIGFAECIAHLSDIGGSISNAARDIYEEGLQIPICKLVEAGIENRLVCEFIEANVRTPQYDMGDLRALIAALGVTEAKVQRLLDEYRLDDLEDVADGIIGRTEAAMREGIRATLPQGTYTYEIRGDGFDEPIVLKASITVGDGSIVVDYSGSSPESRYGINCPLNYATAWTVFALKTIVSPGIPNNLGSFLPVEIVAPERTIINPLRPAPVRMRAATAHYLAPVIQGALAAAVPTRGIAESGSPTWINRFFGTDRRGKPFAVLLGLSGGMGARTGMDGYHCLNYPTNMAATSVEVLEETMPVRILEKSLIRDSGGAGRFRGGCGQRFVMQGLGLPIRTLLQHERTRLAAIGAAGGHPARTGRSRLNGVPLPSKTQIEITAGDVLEIETPGGGGMEAPERRSAEEQRADLRSGLVTAPAHNVAALAASEAGNE